MSTTQDWRIQLAAAAVMTFSLCAAAQTQDPAPQAGALWEAISGGKLLLNVRPRYEWVDQDNKPDRADALTVRTLLGWETKPYYGFSATAQAINVTHVVDDFNADPTQAASSSFPLVADPQDSDANQLFLDYTGVPKTRFRLGKQSIKLDNVRFVGNVEFRQVMQVFNGLTVENKSLPNTELYFGHLERIKTIFAVQRETKIEIAHAAYRWSPADTIIGYGYFQDQPVTGSNTGFADNSNRIFGLRADGAHPFGEHFKLLYTAEYAKQDDYAGGDDRIDADYLHLGIGPRWGDWFVRLDYEQLSSNDGLYAFQTPLGTNHLFQGWADQFLTTPRQGIRDTYLSVGGKVQKALLYAEVHKFKSDSGSIDFGDEFDFGLTYPFTKQLSAKLEYANYREGDVLSGTARKPDLTKLWVTVIFNW